MRPKQNIFTRISIVMIGVVLLFVFAWYFGLFTVGYTNTKHKYLVRYPANYLLSVYVDKPSEESDSVFLSGPGDHILDPSFSVEVYPNERKLSIDQFLNNNFTRIFLVHTVFRSATSSDSSVQFNGLLARKIVMKDGQVHILFMRNFTIYSIHLFKQNTKNLKILESFQLIQ